MINQLNIAIFENVDNFKESAPFESNLIKFRHVIPLHYDTLCYITCIGA